MKYIIKSAGYRETEAFVDEYARAILGADFELERADEDGNFYIMLYSLEDLEKLSEAVGSDIIYESGGEYPTLTIYDYYVE